MQPRNPRRRHWVVQCLFVIGGASLALAGWPGLGIGQEEGNLPDASDDQVMAFAKAHVEVTRIHSTAELETDANLPTTVAEIDADSIPSKEIREEMIQAIEEEGLTLDDYNAMMQAYQTNEDFRSKVVMMVLDLH